MDFNTYDCGYIGGWSIADDKEKEKIIDALNSIPERYLVSAEEAEISLKKVNERMKEFLNSERKLVAADLWYSDGTADTLTQIEGYDMANGGCKKGHVNLSIENAKLQPFIKYQDQLEESMSKLRDVNACLKTLCFMLKQYSLPDEENNVTKFETTQDMAKYFKLLADMCLKASEFD